MPVLLADLYRVSLLPNRTQKRTTRNGVRPHKTVEQGPRRAVRDVSAARRYQHHYLTLYHILCVLRLGFGYYICGQTLTHGAVKCMERLQLNL